MSDPTASDQPAYPPVLTPAAAAAAATPEPASTPAPEPTPQPTPVPEPTPEPKPVAGWKGWVAAGAACGAVVVGGILLTKDDGGGAVGTTSPQTDQVEAFGGLRGAGGEITDIDGTTITVESDGPSGDAGEVTVETDDDTTFTDVVDGDVGDFEVGDSVLVSGELTDGAITAESVTENDRSMLPGGSGPSDEGAVFRDGGPPSDGGTRVFPGGQAPPEGFTPPDGAVLTRMTFGEITAIDGDTITIDSPMDDEAIVVTVTDDTDVKVTEEIAIADLEEGDQIQVSGERDDDVVTADSVRRGDGPMVFGGPASRVAPEASS